MRKWAMSLLATGVLIFSLAAPLFGANTQDINDDSSDFPETTVGKRAAEFIAAYNSADRDKIREYLQTHMPKATLERQPLPSLVDAFASLHAQTGKLNVHGFENESEYSLIIKVQPDIGGDWLDIHFSVDENAPHRQGNLGLTPGRPPNAADYSQWKTLTDLLATLCEETKAPAMAMAIVKDGKVYKSLASGVRKAGGQDQAEVTDRFHAGSVGKSMTAVLIGKLIQHDMLDWQTPIAEVLDDIEMKPEYREVTILQLLNHRGGLPPFTDDREYDRSIFVDSQLSPSQQRLKFVEYALNQEPAGAVGQQMIYSNGGYVVLGVIAERIAGDSYEALMQQHVFEELQMDSAGFGWPATIDRPHEPTGHAKVGNQVQAIEGETIDMGHYMTPAGDMHFSIEDLARYAAFHLEGLQGKADLLDKEICVKLHQPPPGEAYAAGWVIQQAPDGSPMHFHNGSLVTFYAAVFLYPKHNAAVVVATNMGMGVEPDILKAVETVFEKQIKFR